MGMPWDFSSLCLREVARGILEGEGKMPIYDIPSFRDGSTRLGARRVAEAEGKVGTMVSVGGKWRS